MLELGVLDMINSCNEDEIKKVCGWFDLIILIVNVKLDWNLYLFILVLKGWFYFVGVIFEFLDIGVFNLIGG